MDNAVAQRTDQEANAAGQKRHAEELEEESQPIERSGPHNLKEVAPQ